MIRRLLALTAVAAACVALPATPASAVTCVDHPCIYVCWDCLDGPFVGCWAIQDVTDRFCV